MTNNKKNEQGRNFDFENQNQNKGQVKQGSAKQGKTGQPGEFGKNQAGNQQDRNAGKQGKSSFIRESEFDLEEENYKK